MNSTQRSTIASYSSAIAHTLQAEYGIDPRPIFDELGLADEIKPSPTSRLTTIQIAELFDAAVQASGDPLFGVKAGKLLNVAVFHAFGFGLLASSSLRNMCVRASRYFGLISSNAKIRTEEGPDYFKLVHYDLSPTVSPYTVDAWISFLIKLIRQIYSPDFRPIALSLARPNPGECAQGYDEYFGVKVEFGVKEMAICFLHDDIDQPLYGANAEIALANDRIVQEYLSKLDKNDVISRIKMELTRDLSMGHPGKAAVAEALGMSPRTLQNRLQDAGTSYQDVLDDLRLSLAKGYLSDLDMPIGEVTFRLGYSETANFTKAFRKWTGLSPTEYRNERCRPSFLG